MKVALLTVGTEILFGQILNTNSQWLSEELNNMGFDVMYHYTVGDNASRLEELLKFIYHDCDLILTTGGLGPTQDDLTKETIAKAFNVKLIKSDIWMEELERLSRERYGKLTENNYKQAYIPFGSELLFNEKGSAPGFWLEKDGKIIAAMPGPPREMKWMFNEHIRPRLEKLADGVFYTDVIRSFGLGESSMETCLLPLINGQTDPTIATYAKEGECTLRITSKRKTLEEAKSAVKEMEEKVLDIMGEYVYSTSDEDLIDVVGKTLINNKLTISSAESCTGGLFASALTDVPGISEIFSHSIVTYSNEVKMSELGVKKETLDAFTEISPECALEMATGLSKRTGSDISISVTGLAGPDGGTDEKPVGLAYIGVCYNKNKLGDQGGDIVEGINGYKVKVSKTKIRNISRKWNKSYICLQMINEVYQIIKGLNK